MAYYEHWPIYKAAFDLNVYFEQIVRQFSRYHKYALDAELRQQAREVVALIIRANNSADKLPVLYLLRGQLEQLKLTLRLCKEVNAFHNFNSFQSGGLAASGPETPPSLLGRGRGRSGNTCRDKCSAESAWNVNFHNNGNVNWNNLTNDNYGRARLCSFQSPLTNFSLLRAFLLGISVSPFLPSGLSV